MTAWREPDHLGEIEIEGEEPAVFCVERAGAYLKLGFVSSGGPVHEVAFLLTPNEAKKLGALLAKAARGHKQ